MASKTGRPPSGHSETVVVKLHPDLVAHLKLASDTFYCSMSDYLRRLILKDMAAAKSTGVLQQYQEDQTTNERQTQ